MQKGFMCLTDIIDVYSRFIAVWGLSNSLNTASSLDIIKKAVDKYETPTILNSDQGSQFTCKEYIDYLKSKGIQRSRDGKGRALENIFIENFVEQ